MEEAHAVAAVAAAELQTLKNSCAQAVSVLVAVAAVVEAVPVAK